MSGVVSQPGRSLSVLMIVLIMEKKSFSFLAHVCFDGVKLRKKTEKAIVF